MTTKTSGSEKTGISARAVLGVVEPVESKEAKALRLTMKRLDLSDLKEAILCLPASYSDLRTITRVVPDEDDEDRRLYQMIYLGERSAFNKNNEPLNLKQLQNWQDVFRLQMILHDADGERMSWSVFGNPWPYKNMQEGEIVNLVGRVQYFGRKASLQDFECPPPHAIGKIWAKYLGIQGRVAGEVVERLVRSQVDDPDAYRHCATKLVGAIGLRESQALDEVGVAPSEFPTFTAVIKALHAPADMEQGARAKIVAHMLAAAAVQASALRHNLRHAHPQSPLPIELSDLEPIARSLPGQIELSNDQWAAIRAIAAGLKDPKPLNALLSGDVGTGKTLAYLIPAIAAHRAGAQVAIIAPTSILADQIANEILSKFGGLIKGVERVVTGKKIHDHASILVGTPGLTAVAVKSKYTPNILICDEQHKLSTDVREKLVKPWTHLIEVSATPVPRSLASALFGGKLIINIRGCPFVKDINCIVGEVAERRKFGGMIKWALDQGKRAVVVYPRVGKDHKVIPADVAPGEEQPETIASVMSGARALEEAFPGQVIVIHGGMKDEDISRAIELVRSGEKPLVVTTTVIETGVDIPGIATMVIRDADCFGISQLHQLRGRLVRHGGTAWFGMMVQEKDLLPEDTLARLEAVAASQDGYELAERDLIQRGFGEMEGTAQSGSTDSVFRLVKLRPEDFLRHRLGNLSVQGREMPPDADEEPSESRHDQPRLFA